MIRYTESGSTKRKLQARIIVIGAGGAGGNAVNRMIESQVPGVEFISANTDTMALQMTSAPVKIQLGVETCEGLGAGGEPAVGREAALENIGDLEPYLSGSDMVFITSGMGGGTGTGAAPVLARAAKDLGALTVAVVTKPFLFEGKRRMRQALEGIEKLREYADTLLVIPNEKLVAHSTETTTIEQAFAMADEVLYQAVRGISDLITQPGYINLDFADVRKVMGGMGMSLMGTADAEGEERVSQAIHGAVECPLLESHSIDGATGILINVTGGGDLPLQEVNRVIGDLFQRVDPEANIIWGYVFDESYRNKVKATVIATGFDRSAGRAAAGEAEPAMESPSLEESPTAPEPGTEPPLEHDTVGDSPAVTEASDAGQDTPGGTGTKIRPSSMQETPEASTAAEEPEGSPEDTTSWLTRPPIRFAAEDPADPVPEEPESPVAEPEPAPAEASPAMAEKEPSDPSESEPHEPPVTELPSASFEPAPSPGSIPTYRRRSLASREADGESLYHSEFFGPFGAQGRLLLRKPTEAKER